MKSFRIIPAIIMVVFFYSATGHSVIMEYCEMQCETSCCEPADCCSDVSLSSENCCVINNSYLVNPFSISVPQKITLQKPVFTITKQQFSPGKSEFTESLILDRSVYLCSSGNLPDLVLFSVLRI
jgi:hypothetical protein